jgi:hypothetical protein
MIDIPVVSLTPELGACLELRADALLSDGVPNACLELLNRYGTLVFPRISVSDETHVAFSNQLGRMQPTRMSADTLGIYPVTLDPTRAKFLDYIVSNEHWHMDGTTYATPPNTTVAKFVEKLDAGSECDQTWQWTARRLMMARSRG